MALMLLISGFVMLRISPDLVKTIETPHSVSGTVTCDMLAIPAGQKRLLYWNTILSESAIGGVDIWRYVRDARLEGHTWECDNRKYRFYVASSVSKEEASYMTKGLSGSRALSGSWVLTGSDFSEGSFDELTGNLSILYEVKEFLRGQGTPFEVPLEPGQAVSTIVFIIENVDRYDEAIHVETRLSWKEVSYDYAMADMVRTVGVFLFYPGLILLLIAIIAIINALRKRPEIPSPPPPPP
jgi:hypothetical protein